MRFIVVIFGLLIAMSAYASDLQREQKWADEILPSVLVGDPVWLEGSGQHKFLTLFTQVPHAKGAVLLGHGSGVHPDWGLIGMLRQRLADAGYTTLSIQFPVLAADAKADDYAPTFDDAAHRLGKAVEFLKSKGYAHILLVTHSLGGRMAYRYLQGQPDRAVQAWVSISTSGADNWGILKLPILDLYGQNDSPDILQNAPARAAGLKQPGSKQERLAQADHFYTGQDDALLQAVSSFLVQLR